MKAALTEAGIIAALQSVPAGAKPHLGDIRRAIGCTLPELRACIQSMRLKGKLHWERLELAGSLLLKAKVEPAPAVRKDAGVIVERLAQTAAEKAADEEKRQASHRAHEIRLAGESVADAVNREAEGAVARRRLAATNTVTRSGIAPSGTGLRARLLAISAEVDAEEAEEIEARRAGELRDLATPSALLRRALADWPEQCAAVKALAAELGCSLGEAWRRVIGAGVSCMTEDLAEDAT